MSRRERRSQLDSRVDLQIRQLPDPITDAAADNLMLHWIVRLRWPIFVLLAIIQIAAFNGRWRIGRDGSLYRSVAHNLATGQGYTFRGQRETHVYPGLPRMLATVEKIFGEEDVLRPIVSLTIMALLGALTLVIVYQMIRLHFPLWMAVCVTTGVGINLEFLEQSHDFMTDVPFLLGVCLTLLGIGRLWRDQTPRRRTFAVLMAVAGAVITITTRPTFWALALPFIVLCILGIARAQRRWWYAAGAGAVIALVLLWWTLDPRTAGLHPLAGKYESMVAFRLSQMDLIKSPQRLLLTWEKEFPVGLFGFEMIFPLGTLLALTIIAWWIWLLPRCPLWSLYVIVTMLMMLVLGGKPRYFLMILPMMLIAWALAVHWVSLRLRRWPYAPECIMLLGLGVATAPNLIRCIGFIMEQHGFDRTFTRHNFLEVYRGGDMLPVYQMAQLIKQNVPPNKKVIGQESRITTFISGRSVFSASDAIGPARPPASLLLLKKLNPHYLAYGEQVGNGRLLQQLIRRRLVRINWRSMIGQPQMYVVGISIPEVKPPNPAPTTRRAPATQPSK